MSNTYTSIYLHVVFAVKNREAMLGVYLRKRIHAYIARILTNHNQSVIAVGGTDDHVHILFSYAPTKLLTDIIRDVKVSSTKFINDNRLMVFRFGWQRGYACISCSPLAVSNVKNYILNQNEHHKGMTFREEIIGFYNRAGIEYDEKYIFNQLEEL